MLIHKKCRELKAKFVTIVTHYKKPITAGTFLEKRLSLINTSTLIFQFLLKKFKVNNATDIAGMLPFVYTESIRALSHFSHSFFTRGNVLQL